MPRVSPWVTAAFPLLLLLCPAPACAASLSATLWLFFGFPLLQKPVQPPPPGGNMVVNTLSDVYPDDDDDYISFREALYFAEEDALSNRIVFSVSGRLEKMNGTPTLPDGDSILAADASGKPRLRCDDYLQISNNCTVTGLSCGYAVVLQGNNSRLRSCYLGLQLDGQTPTSDTRCHVYVRGSGNVIGSDDASLGNHFGDGNLVIEGESANGNVIKNNLCGLKPDGVSPLRRVSDVAIQIGAGAHDNRVYLNCILGNSACIHLYGSGTHNNRIYGNRLGLNSGGFKSGNGIIITDGAHHNYTISNLVPDLNLRNLIGGYKWDGIQVNIGAHDNYLLYNLVGVDETGAKLAEGAGQYGVRVYPATTNTQIGGGGEAEGNWIAGNSKADVCVAAPNAGQTRASGVTIAGNRIGFDKTYTPRTSGWGILVCNASGVVIGGVGSQTATPRNYVGGCTLGGIMVYQNTRPLRVQGNSVGIGPDDYTTIPNGQAALTISQSSNVNVGAINAEPASSGGPPAPHAGNILAGSKQGVYLEESDNIYVQGNMIGAYEKANTNRDIGVAIAEGCQHVVVGGASPYQANRIHTNLAGVGVTGSSNVLIVNNEIKKSQGVALGGAGGVGVYLHGPVENVILGDNVISRSESHGIVVNGEEGEVKDLHIGSEERGPNYIGDNQGYGIAIFGASVSDVSVLNNWIGAWPATEGAVQWNAHPNRQGGVGIGEEAHGVVVGATTADFPNYICANGGFGVGLGGGAYGNSVTHNFIGRKTPANAVNGNDLGIKITGGAHDNTIGGTNPDLHTFVAGNKNGGIVLEGTGTNHNTVTNCWVGLNYANATSKTPHPDGNTYIGVTIANGACENVIGASSAHAYSNVICASNGCGVLISGSGTRRNKIQRCRIGTDPTGTQATAAGGAKWGNASEGVWIFMGVNNVVGGPNAAYANQISNNGEDGVRITTGGRLNYVAGNLIGTKADGLRALGNGGAGVKIEDSSQNYVGSGTYKKENTISGNAKEGVRIERGDNNEVVMNLIGTDWLGAAAVPNGRAGVVLVGCNDTKIKGTNVIAGNSGDGVEIWRGESGGGDNLVDGNVIGLTKGAAGFLPNGTLAGAGSNTGILVTGFTEDDYISPRNQISRNAIFARNNGLRFVGVGTSDTKPPNGNRVTGNTIGLRADGTAGAGNIGVRVEGCPVYLAGNTLGGCKCAVQVAQAAGFALLKGNTLRDNAVHVQFLGGAKGCLGDAGSSVNGYQGLNVFGASSSVAVDYYAGKASAALKAQLNDWGTTKKAAIRARIKFRQGDTEKRSVIFDPIIGGIHPTAVGAQMSDALVVTALSAIAEGHTATVTFGLSAPAMVTVSILNIGGVPVRTLTPDRLWPARTNVLAWNGLSDRGTRLPAGRYLVRIVARGEDGQEAQALAVLTLGG